VSAAGTLLMPEGAEGIVEVPVAANDPVVLHVNFGGSAPVDSTAVAVPNVERASVRARFHVIGGCFAQPENADRLLNDLRAQGHAAVRLPKRGQLYPVAYGSYADRGQALEALAQVRSAGGGGAWLLVR
jgi:cell division septation protein DedD